MMRRYGREWGDIRTRPLKEPCDFKQVNIGEWRFPFFSTTFSYFKAVVFFTSSLMLQQIKNGFNSLNNFREEFVLAWVILQHLNDCQGSLLHFSTGSSTVILRVSGDLHHFSYLMLTTSSGYLRRGECLHSKGIVRLVTKEGGVHNFLNFYAQVFFQDDFMVELHAQGYPVPLKRLLLHTLTLYYYAF